MKIVQILLGCLSLILGLIGIVLPLLPTTPFLLLSAALFVRSSPRLYVWLLNNPLFGRYIRDYRDRRHIPSRVKYTSLFLVWATLLYCIFAVVKGVLWAQLLLFVLAVAISIHLLSLGSNRPKDN